MDIESKPHVDVYSGGSQEGLAMTSQAAIDPDNPYWGPIVGIGVWIFSCISPAFLFIPWLVFEIAIGNLPNFGSNELELWLTSPRGLLVSVVMTLVGHLLTIGLCWVLVTRWGRQPFFETFGWNWGGLSLSGRFGLVAGVVIGVVLLQPILRLVLPEAEVTPFEEMLKSSMLVRIMLVAMAVLTAPIVEEMVYRGVLYSGLRKKIGVVASTIIVTLLFGGVHQPQYKGAWASLVGLVVLSFLLTLVRVKTRSLLPSVVIHLVYNSIGATFILLSGWE